MVLDVPNVESDDEDDESVSKFEDDDGSITSRKRPKGLGRLHISRLLQMVLQDAQTRLFFKAQSIIQAEIRYYAPRPEDLAYPEKLVGASRSDGVYTSSRISDAFQLPSCCPKPTAQRGASILGKVYPQSDFPGQVAG